jgi:hypothetical protein
MDSLQSWGCKGETTVSLQLPDEALELALCYRLYWGVEAFSPCCAISTATNNDIP